MEKLLLILVKSLVFIVFIVFVLIGFIAMSLLDLGVGLPLWIAIICVYIWGTRNDKDGFYRLFKDIHQSNLDDIERQELEDQEDEVIK
jgi:Na+/H+ antiporter NhaC